MEARPSAIPGDRYWQSTIEQVMLSPARRGYAWRCIIEQIGRVQDHQTSTVGPGSILPAHLSEELAILERSLIDYYRELTKGLGSLLKAIPGLQGAAPSGDLVKDPLWLCVGMLIMPPGSALAFDPAFIFRFIDDYIARASDREKSRISSRMYDWISDMAGLDEILTAVRSHRPRAHPPESKQYSALTKDRLFFWDCEILARATVLGSDQWKQLIPSFQAFCAIPLKIKSKQRKFHRDLGLTR